MNHRAWLAFGCVAVGIVACGGTSSDLIGGGSGDGGSGDGSSGTGGDGGASSDGAIIGDSGGTSDAAPINDSGVCPDIKGRYSISHSGLGCGDLVNDSPQCIDEGNSCDVDFDSKRGDGGPALGVNGPASLQTDGSFSGAPLTLGTIDRTGCVGTWDESSKTMTVTCGGSGVDQSCTVTLTRTGGGGC